MGADPVAPVRQAAATTPRATLGERVTAPSAEEYRAAAILAIGLILKVGMLVTLVGLLGWGGRTVWRRLRRRERR